MTRKPSRGVSEAQIREAIVELVDNHQEPTTTKIRNLLGTGSFTTIGAVLTQWRAEQEAATQSPIPPIPEAIGRYFRRVWQEACQSAADAHESERTGFRTERSRWEGERKELQTEISRLETLLAELDEDLDSVKLVEQQQQRRLAEYEKQLSVAHGHNQSCTLEVERLRADAAQSLQQIRSLSERAAKAETLLEQHQSGNAMPVPQRQKTG
jgi:hypothetical protein